MAADELIRPQVPIWIWPAPPAPFVSRSSSFSPRRRHHFATPLSPHRAAPPLRRHPTRRRPARRRPTRRRPARRRPATRSTTAPLLHHRADACPPRRSPTAPLRTPALLDRRHHLGLPSPAADRQSRVLAVRGLAAASSPPRGATSLARWSHGSASLRRGAAASSPPPVFPLHRHSLHPAVGVLAVR